MNERFRSINLLDNKDIGNEDGNNILILDMDVTKLPIYVFHEGYPEGLYGRIQIMCDPEKGSPIPHIHVTINYRHKIIIMGSICGVPVTDTRHDRYYSFSNTILLDRGEYLERYAEDDKITSRPLALLINILRAKTCDVYKALIGNPPCYFDDKTCSVWELLATHWNSFVITKDLYPIHIPDGIPNYSKLKSS